MTGSPELDDALTLFGLLLAGLIFLIFLKAFLRAQANRNNPDYDCGSGFSYWFDFNSDNDSDGGDCGGDGGD